MYFNVNFNVFFKLIKVHLLVSELYPVILFLTLNVDFISHKLKHDSSVSVVTNNELETAV